MGPTQTNCVNVTIFAWNLCSIIVWFYIPVYTKDVQNSFHHPNLTSPSWTKPQTKAPNSLQLPQELISHLAMKHWSLYWPFLHNGPSVSFCWAQRSWQEWNSSCCSPSDYLMQTGENKGNSLRTQKLGPKYFWQLQAGLWTEVCLNNEKMPREKLPLEC